MNIFGLIVEYNLFYNGYIYYLFKFIEKINVIYIVVIMSGNFL